MVRHHSGQLRIVGGQWRSRKLNFINDGRVRPTPDRVRQTVFDWLGPNVEGTSCLDLFAGSGALGFEALSRGASWTTFVDCDQAQTDMITVTSARLGAEDRTDVIQVDALCWLRRTSAHFDLVFVDPPFNGTLLQAALAELPAVLRAGGYVYVEWPKTRTFVLPPHFRMLKKKNAGQVSYGLLVLSDGKGEHQ